jgi:hypothetical protein
MKSYLSVEGLSPRWTESIDMGVHPCPRRLTCCHGDHGNHACSGGRVHVPGFDRLEISTRELFYQACMGVYGYVCNTLFFAMNKNLINYLLN